MRIGEEFYTLEEVRQAYPKIINPPSRYFEIRNKIGRSPFRPGLPSHRYDPFIQHFEERAQTAHAQAALYARKRKPADAERYRMLARGWSEAAEICRQRAKRSMAEEDTRAAEHRARQAEAEYNAGVAARAEERRRAVSEEND